MKIDIAKVLAMSEEEQWAWVHDDPDIYQECGGGYLGSLANLAFRLRDEACKNDKTAYKYYCALKDCFGHSVHESLDLSLGFGLWAYKYIRPIDMILAALKAKEKK